MSTLFIHTNRKQLFGAMLSKYSFEREAGPNRKFEVKFIIAENLPEMQEFVGKKFISSSNDTRTYTFDDLQSFTLTRFKAPELMGYTGRAIVIDPDIFALPGTNIIKLFNTDLEGAALACVKRTNGKLESSLMVLDCTRLKHWKLKDFLKQLEDKKINKQNLMLFHNGEVVKEIPWYWNSLDKVEGAKILHTTNRLTQPWKTGLKIDFTPRPLMKLFGIIPREPIHKLLGKYPTHYIPHPNKKVVDFFFTLVKDALRDNAITNQEIQDEIDKKNVRPDIFEMLKSY